MQSLLMEKPDNGEPGVPARPPDCLTAKLGSCDVAQRKLARTPVASLKPIALAGHAILRSVHVKEIASGKASRCQFGRLDHIR
jgi:hypothetical protein